MQRAECGMMNAYYIRALFGKEISIMSEKRRDSKNRILQNGESQRKDGKYEFKCVDVNGKTIFIKAREDSDERNEIKDEESYGEIYSSHIGSGASAKDALWYGNGTCSDRK